MMLWLKIYIKNEKRKLTPKKSKREESIYNNSEF